MSTIGELLRDAAAELREHGSESARLDAELLLGHVLGVGRTTILAEPEATVGDPSATQFRDLIARRTNGEPVAYIRGLKEFYGLALGVDRRALIPRPETELIVELGLARIAERLTGEPRPPGSPALLVWDVGTGSGAIAVAIAAECRRRGYAPDVRLRATDSSAEALSLAIENSVAHGVADWIDFAVADLAALGTAPATAPADLILANLPYIPSAVVPALPVAASFEPVAALDGGADGLEVIRRLLAQLPDVLADRGSALLEIGGDQRNGVEAAAGSALPGWQLTFHADLGGHPRVAELTRPPS